jgi:hypothetical protein
VSVFARSFLKRKTPESKAVPKREQSKVVAEAVRRELKRLRLLKAVETSFGAWQDVDHPELVEGTDAYIRETRKSTRDKRSTTLVSNNIKHFELFPDLPVVNWA